MEEVSALKIRVRFSKWGCMKFIGHLDMMRYFQKAVRRAEIDICYSEGFSPHQKMSFAAPLGVGITSDGEYFDIEVDSTESTEKSIAALNATMVDGVKVTGYVKLPDDAKTAMSLVAAADYTLSYKEGYSLPASFVEIKTGFDKYFIRQESFTIIKKTKKSEKEVDLKPLVYKLEIEEQNNKPVFHINVSTGSNDNIKPELVIASVYEKCGFSYCPEAIQIHRNEVYTRASDGSLLSLMDMGEEIK